MVSSNALLPLTSAVEHKFIIHEWLAQADCPHMQATAAELASKPSTARAPVDHDRIHAWRMAARSTNPAPARDSGAVPEDVDSVFVLRGPASDLCLISHLPAEYDSSKQLPVALHWLGEMMSLCKVFFPDCMRRFSGRFEDASVCMSGETQSLSIIPFLLIR